MKRWRPIAAVVLCFLGLLLLAGTALAQGAGPLPPVLANVVTKVAVLVNGVLGFWVTDNTLTDPAGKDFVGSLGQLAVNVVDFLARLVILF